jgi:hypothetical protein
MYSGWNPGNTVSPNTNGAKTVDELRASPRMHVILSVDEAKERVAAVEIYNVGPQCGRMPPEIAWGRTPEAIRRAGLAMGTRNGVASRCWATSAAAFSNLPWADTESRA